MYNKTKTKSEEILKLYEEGVILTKICEMTSSSQFTVKKVLVTGGIDYDTVEKEKYQKKLKRAIELYKEGKSQLFIEKELGFTRKTLRNLFKSRDDLSYRSKSEQHFIRYGTEIDESVFDELIPEALYWIGMLYTDGFLTSRREYGGGLTQHTNDMKHLEKFKSFLKSTRPITPDHGDCHRVRFNSKKIHGRLMELGFTSNKSYTGKPHELLKHSRDFWRGCIDGDGGVYNYTERNVHQLFMCGTLETVFDFIVFCSKYVGIKEKCPTKCQGPNHYEISYYAQDARKVAEYLYKDACVYLDRKYEKYLEIVNNN